MERLFASHFAGRASRIMGRLASTELPSSLLKPLISAYAVGLGVNLGEALEPEGGYKSFSDFFGRRLRPGTRPIPSEADVIVSPCDGELVSFGEIQKGNSPSFTIKGSCYDIDSLLGASGYAESYGGGDYCVIYLHPRDYHRVHIPVDAGLMKIRHIPGARYPVNHWLENRVEGIYGKNERVVFHCTLPNKGELTLIMVAAFGVGNIETTHAMGSVSHMDACCERDFDPLTNLKCGEELGSFLLGSTVVMLWSRGAMETDGWLVRGPVQMGSRIGRMC